MTWKLTQIRKRLSPETKTDIDELGVILPTDNTPDDANASIPSEYWNLSGALYAYLYMRLAVLRIEIIGESQLVGYPSQFPSVTMIDWKDGKPNARYWVLKLIRDNFGPGDELFETRIDPQWGVAAQAFVTPFGKRLLLINKRDRPVDVKLPGSMAITRGWIVDESTGEGAARLEIISSTVLRLNPFAVVVLE